MTKSSLYFLFRFLTASIYFVWKSKPEVISFVVSPERFRDQFVWGEPNGAWWPDFYTSVWHQHPHRRKEGDQGLHRKLWGKISKYRNIYCHLNAFWIGHKTKNCFHVYVMLLLVLVECVLMIITEDYSFFFKRQRTDFSFSLSYLNGNWVSYIVFNFTFLQKYLDICLSLVLLRCCPVWFKRNNVCLFVVRTPIVTISLMASLW